MISVNIDLSDLQGLFDIGAGLKSVTSGMAGDVAQMIKSKATELANERLHSRRKMYIDGLSIREESDDTFVVSLDGKVRWIDDGLSPMNLLESLLKSPKAKRAKDGSTYITVPFEHGPGKGAGSFAEKSPQLDIISTIKSEMKKRAIPWSKIEKDASGAAKIGRLHAFDITKAPLKTVDGPGMGHGAIGDVRQGTTGIPFLQNVSVYQGVDGKGKAKRGILTFRVASSKHKDQGKWEHPGTSQTNILDDAAEWALKEFQDKIAPEVMKNILNPDED